MFIAPYYRVKMPKIVDTYGIELWVYLTTDSETPPVCLYCTESGDDYYLEHIEFTNLLINADRYDDTLHVNLAIINKG